MPQSPQQFLVSHSSGQIYLYNEDLPSGTTPPHYQLFKQGFGFSVHTCKAKSTRNPLYRWVLGPSVGNGPPPVTPPVSNSMYSCPTHNQSTVVHHHNHTLSAVHQRHHSTNVTAATDSGTPNPTSASSSQVVSSSTGVSSSSSGGFFPFSSSNSATTPNGGIGGASGHLISSSQPGPAINQFAFSPCGRFLAVVSQDGYLRVFEYHKMELLGQMRSYFGGLLCCAWSPDGRFVAVGGEDDLVTVWALAERQVVCRCQGHRSWVNVVQFDPYLSSPSTSDQQLHTSQLKPQHAVHQNGDVSPTSIHSDEEEVPNEGVSSYSSKTYR